MGGCMAAVEVTLPVWALCLLLPFLNGLKRQSPLARVVVLRSSYDLAQCYEDMCKPQEVISCWECPVSRNFAINLFTN